ncbi:pyridoxal phosphate-dependent aminotransferase [Fimbriiglobus ruber]|uniref:Aspartate aminotransferase n=1 Tax=Fimbriiglobus ruber TaxID=1908690 RepID=A0A225DR95_9BACT|nr:aminotransferase class I/II-fold pyridoxal phosphate-dependent enzyme [Fimbriiglobus ruber]OWK38885.1 Aspartate aminotransferase [Fimbriiglobus ruber]
MSVSFSTFASSLTSETAFDVLAVAKRLKAAGKDVIELQIGDSPFPSASSAIAAGKAAIDAGLTRYGPSLGLPEFRETIAETVRAEFGIPATADHVVVAPGAKPFQQFFCEVFLEPDDEVLVFEPAFPTFAPNITRRGAKPVYVPLRQENAFRPDPTDVARFLQTSSHPKAIFLNSPHNPTGGVATADDLRAIADLIRGKNVALFSDEPYCHMVWDGRHRSILAEPGMLDQCVGAYTFSKSYSMSGWRCGFAVASPAVAQMVGKMINTSLSCVPPFVQLAGQAALRHDAAERDATMQKFHTKVKKLVDELRTVEGVTVLMPAGTFYAFPNVRPICDRFGITSHGLAMYLLEGADDARGVACLGGESFGAAGYGFIRFSCSEPDDRLVAAVDFLKQAITRTDRVAAYLEAHPKYRVR